MLVWTGRSGNRVSASVALPIPKSVRPSIFRPNLSFGRSLIRSESSLTTYQTLSYGSVPVCFSVNEFKDCITLRENNSIEYSNAIYHLGKCVTNQTELDRIMANVTKYYAVSLWGSKSKPGDVFSLISSSARGRFPSTTCPATTAVASPRPRWWTASS